VGDLSMIAAMVNLGTIALALPDVQQATTIR
jgi:hypothetical protein